MTTEPREEANAIVRGVASFDWPSGAEWDHHYELVVDVLAAAIEWREADKDWDDVKRFTAAQRRLREALSALREGHSHA